MVMMCTFEELLAKGKMSSYTIRHTLIFFSVLATVYRNTHLIIFLRNWGDGSSMGVNYY
jgi:hypothetical protein